MEPNVCCDASVGPPNRTACQLYVGHEGHHAALVSVDAGRLLRRWSKPRTVVDVEFTGAEAAGLPWAPGNPAAATTGKARLSVVSVNHDAVPSAKNGRLHIA